MKKKIVIMMVLLLAVVGAKAQEVENPAGRFSVIPRIGVSLANWSGLTLETLDGTSLESKYQAGFMGGADVEYRINKGLGITLGAYYARQGMRFPDCELTENAEKGEYTGIKNHHVNLDYIQVPLMLKAYLCRGFVGECRRSGGIPLWRRQGEKRGNRPSEGQERVYYI